MKRIRTLLALGAALAITTASHAAATRAFPNHCFFAGEFQTWRAPDSKTIFIRTSTNRYYRLDLAGACPELTWPAVHLVTKFHGSDAVCSAADWDIKVAADIRGFATPCIVRAMTPLSADEVAAIPPKYRP